MDDVGAMEGNNEFTHSTPDCECGVEEGIIHLVVWVKFELEDDPATDDLTPRARKEIDDYVKKTFCSRMPPEQVSSF